MLTEIAHTDAANSDTLLGCAYSADIFACHAYTYNNHHKSVSIVALATQHVDRFLLEVIRLADCLHLL